MAVSDARRTRVFQLRWNAFTRRFGLHYKPLAVDGKRGTKTRTALKLSRYYLGLGDANWKDNPVDVPSAAFVRMLDRPLRGSLKRRRLASKRRKARVKRWKAAQTTGPRLKGTSPWSPHWGGSRYVVEATRPIAARHGHPITSTKRWPPIGGNYGSWHNSGNQPRAWADDYATFNGAQHAQEIRSYWGNRSEASGTYATYLVRVDGRIFRKQTLWAVQGHYDHVHDGAAV